MTEKKKKEHKHEEHKHEENKKEDHKEQKKEKKKSLSLAKVLGIIIVIGIIGIIALDYSTDNSIQNIFILGEPIETGDEVFIDYKVYVDGKVYDEGNFTFMAGSGQVIAGFDEEIIGMKAGEKASFTVPPEKGYGLYDEEATQSWPLTQEIDSSFNLTKEEFTQSFGEDPVVGEEYEVVSLPWYVAVTSIENDTVYMKHQAVDGESVELPYGSTIITVEGEMIKVRLDPIIGEKFTTIYGPQGPPTIISANNTHMIIDYNHGLAGEILYFEVKILEVKKQSEQSTLAPPQ